MSSNPNFTVTLTAVGASPMLRVGPEMCTSQYQPFTILALVNGALTYSIEVTGDNVDAPGYSQANGIWVPMTGLTGLSASATQSLALNIMGIRARVTAFTSGSLVTQFVWRTAFN